jgi:spermidine synthase
MRATSCDSTPRWSSTPSSAGGCVTSSARRAGVLSLLFASGACSLVYQLAWTREFRLIFGASTLASAAVTAVFVGGLGLGAWRLGARADHAKNPLALYAGLELGVAASAALTPLLVLLAEQVYLATGGSVALGLAGATAVRLLLTTIVLSIPTFLMGGTLPAVARAVTHDDPTRRGVALLYAANTLGAVVGCLAANFALIEALGIRCTLWGAAAANVGVAALAWWLSRRSPASTAPALVDPPSPVLPPGAPAPFVLAAAAIVGFAFFLMEMVFYRMLVPLLGGTVYTFGLVLAVALLGIGLGSALYAATVAHRAVRASAFAFTCLLEAVGLALPYALGDRLAILAIRLRALGEHGFVGYVAGWAVVTAIVVLPASIAAGAQFPLLVALLGRGDRDVARHVGLAYAWNTLGAIAGALAGGFGLMRVLSAPGCWRYVVDLLVALAAVGALVAGLTDRREARELVDAVAGWERGRRIRRWIVPATQALVGLAVVGLVASAEGPTAAWRHTPIGAGRVDPHMVEFPAVVRHFVHFERSDVAWEIDGVESSVAVRQLDGYAFIVNGKSDGHCVSDAATQVMGGLLGALFHPNPRTALVIGLGSGSSAGWLARIPTIDRVDVVELEPAMRHVARMCAPVNEHALENPKLHFVEGDAREVLSVSRARYDVIFSEPSNPYRAGVASLYTREYYDRANRHLAPGGLFVQWVQAYDIDAATLRTIFATLSSVFPYVEVWRLASNDLALIGSREPILRDAAALRARVASEPFRRALHVAWGTEGLEGVLAHYVAGPSVARTARETTRLNTDDRPTVEFGFAKAVGASYARPGLASGDSWIRGLTESPRELVTGDIDIGRIDLERGESPSWEHPLDSLALQARMLEKDGRPIEAADVLERAFAGMRDDPWVARAVREDALNNARDIAADEPALAPRMLELLVRPLAVELSRTTRIKLAVSVATTLDLARGCRALVPLFEQGTPWDEEILRYRRDCYRVTGNSGAQMAEDELWTFRRTDKSPFWL